MTEELYRHIAEIDAAKGSWKQTGKLLPQVVERLTHSVIVTSTGSSNRFGGKRLHEGIKRGEIKAADLSKAIQEKDSEHCSAKVKSESLTQRHSKNSNDSNRAIKSAETAKVEDIDLGSVDLSGEKLAETTGDPSVPSVADVSGGKVNQR